MIIWVIFLTMMSLIKNKLEWVKLFVGQLSFRYIIPGGLPVIQNLQNLIRWPSNELDFYF